jgi:hypothetical protein
MQPYKKLWNGYFKFDILNTVPNLDFERAYSMRLTFKLRRLKIPVVFLEHLIHIRRIAADSEKDKRQGKHLADIAVLEALKTR